MRYCMDATLPNELRLSSLKFKRVFERFRSTNLNPADGIEVVAFIQTVGFKAAQHIFQWDKYGVSAAKKLMRHKPYLEAAKPYVIENLTDFDVDDGLALLRLMVEAGWRGPLPLPIQAALATVRKQRTLRSIAKEFGVSEPTMGGWIRGYPRLRRMSRRSVARAALEVG